MPSHPIHIASEAQRRRTRVGKVLPQQLVLLHLEPRLDELHRLVAADSHERGDLLVAADAEAPHRVARLAVDRLLAGQLLEHLHKTWSLNALCVASQIMVLDGPCWSGCSVRWHPLCLKLRTDEAQLCTPPRRGRAEAGAQQLDGCLPAWHTCMASMRWCAVACCPACAAHWRTTSASLRGFGHGRTATGCTAPAAPQLTGSWCYGMGPSCADVQHQLRLTLPCSISNWRTPVWLRQRGRTDTSAGLPHDRARALPDTHGRLGTGFRRCTIASINAAECRTLTWSGGPLNSIGSMRTQAARAAARA
jgi:hypothetical protein